MYRRWAQLLPDAEVWGVNYPGREALHGLPFANSPSEIVQMLLEQMSVWNEKKLWLYGHSFGAMMAFSTALQLQQLGVRPATLLVSARRAPHLPATETFSDLSDSEFLTQLDRFGGVPAAIRNDPDMMAFYTPIIRADLDLNDRACHAEGAAVDAPLYLFSARYDKAANSQELAAWKHCTRGHFSHRVFEGGHFFIQDDAEGFAACLRSIIQAESHFDDEELIAF